jgi:hypothetical protein
VRQTDRRRSYDVVELLERNHSIDLLTVGTTCPPAHWKTDQELLDKPPTCYSLALFFTTYSNVGAKVEIGTPLVGTPFIYAATSSMSMGIAGSVVG